LYIAQSSKMKSRSGGRHFHVNPRLVATCTTSGFCVDESRARSGA